MSILRMQEAGIRQIFECVGDGNDEQVGSFRGSLWRWTQCDAQSSTPVSSTSAYTEYWNRWYTIPVDALPNDIHASQRRMHTRKQTDKKRRKSTWTHETLGGKL
jgi:hypothetical protein